MNQVKFLCFFPFYFLCLVSSGQQKLYESWESTYGGADSLFDAPMAIDAHQCIYVGGTTQTTTNGLDMVVVKYDKTGNQLWTRNYNGASTITDQLTDIAFDASCSVYISGLSITSQGFLQIVVI